MVAEKENIYILSISNHEIVPFPSCLTDQKYDMLMRDNMHMSS